MSESLPENNSKEVLKVLKLVSGEEVIGLITEADSDFITFKYPALLQNYFSKDEKNQVIEYIKLLNYLSSIKGNTVSISKKVIIYIGEPAPELQKMYEIYHMAIQTDPKSIENASSDSGYSPEPGLHLLNELFNNEDFVGFVNDLIDTFEGIEISEEMEELLDVESDIEPSSEEPPEPQPKRKKRKRVKPETNKLPYNPEANPESPESWSDNPSDYI